MSEGHSVKRDPTPELQAAFHIDYEGARYVSHGETLPEACLATPRLNLHYKWTTITVGAHLSADHSTWLQCPVHGLKEVLQHVRDIMKNSAVSECHMSQ